MLLELTASEVACVKEALNIAETGVKGSIYEGAVLPTIKDVQDKIAQNQSDQELYLLCASRKHGFAYNSMLFWGKNDSGYYPDINKCQLYTKEEALQRAKMSHWIGAIPIKVSEVQNYLACHVEHASHILDQKIKEFKDDNNA